MRKILLILKLKNSILSSPQTNKNSHVMICIFSSETVVQNKDFGTLGLSTQFSRFSGAGQNMFVKEELMKWRLIGQA